MMMLEGVCLVSTGPRSTCCSAWCLHWLVCLVAFIVVHALQTLLEYVWSTPQVVAQGMLHTMPCGVQAIAA